MRDSNGKGPLYFVFLNKNKELMYAGTTDGINDNDLNLNMVTPDGDGNQDHRIDDVVNKIMNNDTMKKYFSKNSSSVDESKDENKNDEKFTLRNMKSHINNLLDNKNTFINNINGLKQPGNDIVSTNELDTINVVEDIFNNCENSKQLVGNTSLTNHKIVNVGGDGNCFFYALFYSILAKCDNGEGATNLIKILFNIDISIDDDHVAFAKNSLEHKTSYNNTRNQYKPIEVDFVTKLRTFIKNNDYYKNILKRSLEGTKNNSDPGIPTNLITQQFEPAYQSIVENYLNGIVELNETIELFCEKILATGTNEKNEDTYPEADGPQTNFIIQYLKDTNRPMQFYIQYYFNNNNEKDYYFFDYPNVIRLYKSTGHYQYIIPDSSSSEKGGGKRKTQRKRPKSSHKNKSIKTK